MRIVGAVLGAILAVMALGFAFQGYDFFMFKFWAPKMENVKREVFQNTYSYNRGMIQELENMQMEYVKAGPDEKKAMASIILHRVGEFDENKLPPDLYAFIEKLRRERGL